MFDAIIVSEPGNGRPSSPPAFSSELWMLASAFDDIQRVRKQFSNRAFAAGEAHAPAVERLARDVEKALHKTEQQIARRMKSALRRHLMWDWLAQFPGLSGPLAARLIAIIDDPMRFPGQQCTRGHHYVPRYPEGVSCPTTDDEGTGCPGTMLPPRAHSGVRSLWHYFGLHVVNGQSPRRAKGHKTDWSPKARTLVLQPNGIADQIVRHRTPTYRDLYDRTKERIAEQRGVVAEVSNEIGRGRGDDPQHVTAVSTDEIQGTGGRDAEGGAVVGLRESDNGFGRALRPFQIEAIAKKVAAKAFLGDFLVEWKQRLGAETPKDGADLLLPGGYR